MVHRDYAVSAPVQIRVFDDRLKIWNPAVLPDGWTVKTLLHEHASLPFNPVVANAFFQAGEIEAGGWRSKVSPQTVIGSLLSWQAEGLPIMLCGTTLGRGGW